MLHHPSRHVINPDWESCHWTNFTLNLSRDRQCSRHAANDSACCAVDLVGPVSQRLDVEVIRDSQEGSAVSLPPHMLLCTCAMLCCAVLCCAVLCCAVLCCAVLCAGVLCYAMMCCTAWRCTDQLMMSLQSCMMDAGMLDKDALSIVLPR